MYRLLPFFILFFLFLKNVHAFTCPDGTTPATSSNGSGYSNAGFQGSAVTKTITLDGYSYTATWYQTGGVNVSIESVGNLVSEDNNSITYGTRTIYKYFNTPSMLFRAYWTGNTQVCYKPCQDGGDRLNGSCDRSCEDVGMVTGPTLTIGVPPQCEVQIDCNQRFNDCITKCGGKDNVLSKQCKPSINLETECVCKSNSTEGISDILDNNPIDTQTDTADSNKLTNNLLQDSINAQNDTNQLLSNQSDLLNNQTDLLNDLLNKNDFDDTNIVNAVNEAKTELQEIKSELQDMNSEESFLDYFSSNSVGLATTLDDADKDTKLQNATDSLSDESVIQSFTDKDVTGAIGTSMSDVFSLYSNALGLTTSYGTKPSNITVDLMGETFTIINYSLLDDYISHIRNLFIGLAYLYGFIFLLRKD